MKFITANITFLSTKEHRSIYSLNDGESAGINFWNVNITKASVDTQHWIFTIEYTHMGYQYRLILKSPFSDFNFEGIVICDKEPVGSTHLTLFQNKNSMLFKGDWEEKWGKSGKRNFDCFILLKM